MAYAAEATPSEGRSTQAPVDRQASPWFGRALAAVDRNWRWALAVLLLVDGVLLLYMGRGLTFFYDDWNFVTEDYGGGIHSLLRAHVGNISIFPIAIYKVLFHLVGLNHYAVFRLVVIGLHLLCGALVFVLAARRIPRVPALLAAALILFLGAAWEDLLWAFQVGYMLSVAGGLAAWVLLERKGRWSEIAAMLCVLVATGSSSLGIAVMVGVAVELAWERRWRSAWIVLIPAFLYALWYLGYGESQLTENGLINAPGFAEDLAAAAFGGLVGRALEWGRPLALLGVLVVLRRLIGPVPISARLAGLLATGVALWAVTAVARSTISQPEASRYIYLGAVVIVLTGVELLHEVTITPRMTAWATVVIVACAVAGLTVLRNGAVGLRTTSKTVKADLGALELAAAYAPPGFQPDPQGAPQILAGPYLHTVRAIGSSPADTIGEIEDADPVSRAAADRVLLTLDAPTVRPITTLPPSPVLPAPEVVGLTTGTHTQVGNCARFLPGSTPGAVVLRVKPGSQLLMHAARGPAVEVSLRRFGDPSALHPVGSVAGGGNALLALPADRATGSPWYVNLSAAQPTEACSR